MKRTDHLVLIGLSLFLVFSGLMGDGLFISGSVTVAIGMVFLTTSVVLWWNGRK